MAFVTLNVRGIERNVSVPNGTKLNPGSKVRGKTRVNGRTVRGVVRMNVNGVKSFSPSGSNAGLL